MALLRERALPEGCCSCVADGYALTLSFAPSAAAECEPQTHERSQRTRSHVRVRAAPVPPRRALRPPSPGLDVRQGARTWGCSTSSQCPLSTATAALRALGPSPPRQPHADTEKRVPAPFFFLLSPPCPTSAPRTIRPPSSPVSPVSPFSSPFFSPVSPFCRLPPSPPFFFSPLSYLSHSNVTRNPHQGQESRTTQPSLAVPPPAALSL